MIDYGNNTRCSLRNPYRKGTRISRTNADVFLRPELFAHALRRHIANRAEYIGADVEIAGSVDGNLLRLFFDPQTAGGMLIAINESASEALLARLRENYPNARIIGRVHPQGPRSIVVSTD